MINNDSPLVQPTTDHSLKSQAPEQSLSASPAPILIPGSQSSTLSEPGKPKKDYALITGASSGIGEAFARELAKKKKPLVLVARNEEKLKKLAAELREKEGIDVRFLPIDLARSKEIPFLPEKLKRMGINVDVLINCAGFGKMGTEANISYEDALNMVNLNCRAVLSMTKIFLPDMIKHKKGGIINIAAIAGLFPTPYMATYSASKAFVITYSQALAEELKRSGVRVLCVCPGPTATSFYDRAGINTSKYPSLQKLNDPQTIAEKALAAFRNGKTFEIVDKTSIWNRYLPKLIPRNLLLKHGSALLGVEQAN